MDIQGFMQILDKQLQEMVDGNPMLYGQHNPANPKAVEFAKDRAFVAWCLLHLVDYPAMEIQEAVEAIVDGAEDKGIDAIYVPEKGKRILVLQAKHRRNPQGTGIRKNDIIQVFNGLEWLLDGDLSRIQENLNFQARAEEFREAYQSFEYEGVKAVFAATVGHGLGREAQDEIDAARARFERRGTRLEVEVLTVEDLRQLFISQVHQPFSLAITLQLVRQPYMYEAKDQAARALVGTVSGVDLAELYDEYRHRLLAANIRNSLGNVKINKGIRETAKDPEEACNFWFYNNGITFVCDEFGFRSLTDTAVKLDNAQIINGAQTISSLWKVWNDPKTSQTALHDVDVIVRIIERKGDVDFRRKVTLCANSQNAVYYSDLVGTDTIQLELKRRLLEADYYYEIRRGDYRAERDDLERRGTVIKESFSLKLAAQALGCFFEQIPAIAKSQTSRLFLTGDDGGYYDLLFPPTIDSLHLIMAVACLQEVGKIRDFLSGKKELEGQNRSEWLSEAEGSPVWLPHADHFLTALIAHRFFNMNLRLDMDYVERFWKWVESEEESFREAYRFLIGEIGRTVKKREKDYGYSHPKFFKSQSEYNDLRDSVKAAYRE
jgi:hypothetical protein